MRDPEGVHSRLRAHGGFGKKMWLELRDALKPFLQLVPGTKNEELTKEVSEPLPEPEPVTPPFGDETPPEKVAATILNLITPRKARVLELRFGLGTLDRPRSLEETGLELQVTRERARQIEVAALREVSALTGVQSRIASYLSTKRDSVWEQLAGKGPMLRGDQIATRKRHLLGAVQLLIEVAFDTVEKYCEQHFSPRDGAYINTAIGAEVDPGSAVRLESALATLGIPCQVTTLAEAAGTSVAMARTWGAMKPELIERLGYFISSRGRRRTGRTARLHTLLCLKRGNKGLQLNQLHDAYRDAFLEDQCSDRDVLISLTQNRNLFLNCYADGWRAIGAPGEQDVEMPGELSTTEEEYPEDDASQDEQQTSDNARGLLREALRARGPMSIGEIRDYFKRAPKHKRLAQGSQGAILATSSEFRRLAPGIYGLDEHLAGLASATDPPQALLDHKQIQYYVMARWGGDPSVSFPLWTPKTEMGWCKWAQQNADSNLFSSLLHVVVPSSWPADRIEQATWSELKANGGRFMLAFDTPHSLTLGNYTNDQLIAIALHAKEAEAVSWTTANMVSGKRPDDIHSAGALAFFIAVGALRPADHWQQRHTPDTYLERLISELVATRPFIIDEGAQIAWRRDLLNRLFPRRDLGWLKAWQMQALIDEGVEAPRIADLRSGAWTPPFSW